jgi:hypothetical protein
MTPADLAGPAGRASILVAGDVLFGDDPADPRPLSDARLAIERLGWFGRPVVLVGERIAGRLLPSGRGEREAWVRAQLGSEDLLVELFDETAAVAQGDGTDRPLVERWGGLRDAWDADRLITGNPGSVGPARRAGITVVRIGPGDGSFAATVERADHVARDLLGAVRCVMIADAFSPGP